MDGFGRTSVGVGSIGPLPPTSVRCRYSGSIWRWRTNMLSSNPLTKPHPGSNLSRNNLIAPEDRIPHCSGPQTPCYRHWRHCVLLANPIRSVAYPLLSLTVTMDIFAFSIRRLILRMPRCWPVVRWRRPNSPLTRLSALGLGTRIFSTDGKGP